VGVACPCIAPLSVIAWLRFANVRFSIARQAATGRDRPFGPDALGCASSGGEVNVPLSGKANGNSWQAYLLQLADSLQKNRRCIETS
jgi:hypothetical protein